MNAIFVAAEGGLLEYDGEHIVAEIDCPPGRYLAMATGYVASGQGECLYFVRLVCDPVPAPIEATYTSPHGSWTQGRVNHGDIGPERAMALQLAVDSAQPLRISLRATHAMRSKDARGRVTSKLYVLSPRVSVQSIDALQVLQTGMPYLAPGQDTLPPGELAQALRRSVHGWQVPG